MAGRPGNRKAIHNAILRGDLPPLKDRIKKLQAQLMHLADSAFEEIDLMTPMEKMRCAEKASSILQRMIQFGAEQLDEDSGIEIHIPLLSDYEKDKDNDKSEE